MSGTSIRETVIARLQELSDEQIAEVLEFIGNIQSQHIRIVPSEGDDPLVGFISGPTDFAERSQEILRAEFGKANQG